MDYSRDLDNTFQRSDPFIDDADIHNWNEKAQKLNLWQSSRLLHMLYPPIVTNLPPWSLKITGLNL